MGFGHERTPYVLSRFYAFAQLTDGVGETAAVVRVRKWDGGEIVFASQARTLIFRNPIHAIQAGFIIKDCTFHESGEYVVE